MLMDVKLAGGNSSFRPGQKISGSFSWALEDQPERVELRLFWCTHGKGIQDVTIVRSRRVDSPGMMGRETFEFRLPDGPYTMHGKLVSVLWGLELVAGKSSKATRVDLVVSPWGEPVVLGEPKAGR